MNSGFHITNMSFRNFGRYSTSLRDAHTAARQSNRVATLARGRTIPLSVAAEVISQQSQTVAPTVNGNSLNLPVPKKKKKSVKVTRRTLLRDVQQLKNKLNKRELKAMGISYGDTPLYTYSSSHPEQTGTNYQSIFVSHPCHDDVHAPVLTQGTGNGERIGDKVYYVSARYRLVFRLNISAFKLAYAPDTISTANLPIAGTPTSAPWTATYTSVNPVNPSLVSPGLTFPLRVVSLAIREDYLDKVMAGTNRSRLALHDIFTNLNDYDGNGGNIGDDDLTKTWLYSRKVKNEAAGKVRIKSDNIHYLSTTGSPTDVVVIDKSIPIRQQYSFEKGKLDGWVHGVLVHIPNTVELQRWMHGATSMNWSNFSLNNPVVKFMGGVCFYYYDD